jgi:hypothetical protein
MPIPAEIQKILHVFLAGLSQTIGEKLVGVYLYGALTFPDSGTIGDIDFHVILKSPLDQQERSQLQSLHLTLAQQYPPLGAELDGYYLLLEDSKQKTPPKDQLHDEIYDNSWALHCAHIRQGRCIALFGPDPSQIYPLVTWLELESALEGELDFVARHLDEYPAYCVLNLCRLMYSYTTRDVVVSKRFSAEWAGREFSEWAPLIHSAERYYDHQTTFSDDQLLDAKAGSFFVFACDQIKSSKELIKRK